MDHPLKNSLDDWCFMLPSMGVIARYTFKVSGDKRSHTQTVSASGSCREGIACDLREILKGQLGAYRALGSRPWDKEFVLQEGLRAVLNRRATLWISRPHSKRYVEQLPTVTDYILGTCSVLLDPEMRWWKTKQPLHVEDNLKSKLSGNKVFWRGGSNWFLQHPATVGLATGLLRQCYNLCVSGFGQQVLDSASASEVEGVLSARDPKKAIALAKKLRPWIEVPVSEDGDRDNYAVPMGLWRRFIRLHRAVRRYGYEETLGQDFATGWNLREQDDYYEGPNEFWGDRGGLTKHHRRLMRLGAPGKKEVKASGSE